jgi:hypothetical protein
MLMPSWLMELFEDAAGITIAVITSPVGVIESQLIFLVCIENRREWPTARLK